MHSENDEEKTWRLEFEALSPTQRLAAVTPNPHEFAPTPKTVFWRALHARDESVKREEHDKETRRLASEANDIARSQTKAAWRAARWAMYAALVAAAAAIAANKEQILALVFGSER